MSKLSLFIIFTQLISASSLATTLKLSPQKAVNQALEASDKIKQIRIKKQQARIIELRATGPYVFGASLDYSLESTQAESLSGFSNEQDDTHMYSFGFQKKFSSRTLTSLSFNRISKDSVLSSFTSNLNLPDQQTQDVVNFRFEQDLWQNSFGSIERQQIQNARELFKSASMQEKEEMEAYLIEVMTLFWSSYLEKRSFEEAIESRTRYKKLLKTVKKKKRLGFVAPGELARTHAEYKLQDHLVKQTSLAYLKSVQALATILNYENIDDIDFEIKENIPTLPLLKDINLDQLRPLRILNIVHKNSSRNINIAKSQGRPILKFVGSVSSTGLESERGEAFSEMTSLIHPTQYVGLNLKFTMGSDLLDGEVQFAKYEAEIARLNIIQNKKQLKDQIDYLTHAASANHILAKGAIELIKHRTNSMKEISRAYYQGRTDIQNLILSYSSLSQALINHIRAIGNYHLSLNQLAAARDELIK